MDWNGTQGPFNISESSLSYYYDYNDSAVQDHFLWSHRTHMLWKVTGPIILILGTFGNTAIILILHKMLSDASVFPMLFMALAITNLLLLYMFLLPRWVAEQFDYWFIDANATACKMLTWLEFTLRTLMAWLLAAMTAQHAITIVRPIKIFKVKPCHQALITLAVLIFFSFAFNMYTLHGMHTQHGFEEDFCFWVTDFEFGAYVPLQWMEFLLNCVLPFIIMTACNWLMIRAISTERYRRMSDLHNTNSSNTQRSPVTLTLIVVSLIFILLASPYYIMLITQGQHDDLKSHAEFLFWFNVTLVMWITNSAVNFFLYILMGSRFREECRRLFSRRERSSIRSFSSSVELGGHSHHVVTTDF